MAHIIRPEKGRIRAAYYRYVFVRVCPVCGCGHWYRKVATPQERFDGRRYRYGCAHDPSKSFTMKKAA